MNTGERLPVPVLDFPRWRVRIVPIGDYEVKSVPSLGALWSAVQGSVVRLRGSEFPPLPGSDHERGAGNTWIDSWSDFMGHYEYWRLYQSRQFLYLGSIREVTEASFFHELREGYAPRLHQGELPELRGYISIPNCIYTITEFFEFAARMSQREFYRGQVEIQIELIDVAKFVLTVPRGRLLRRVLMSSASNLSNTWTISTVDAVARAPSLAVDAVIWFFERFGAEEAMMRDSVEAEQRKYVHRES